MHLSCDNWRMRAKVCSHLHVQLRLMLRELSSAALGLVRHIEAGQAPKLNCDPRGVNCGLCAVKHESEAWRDDTKKVSVLLSSGLAGQMAQTLFGFRCASYGLYTRQTLSLDAIQS
jgi:hypothetical protein